MSSHNKQGTSLDNITELVMEKSFPIASNDPFDEDEEAQERRREERRRRKKENRREKMLPAEEGDPDLLLETPKKQKRKKKKKPRPDLWYDERLDDDAEAFDEALEYDDGYKDRRKNQDDWHDEWDS